MDAVDEEVRLLDADADPVGPLAVGDKVADADSVEAPEAEGEKEDDADSEGGVEPVGEPLPEPVEELVVVPNGD